MRVYYARSPATPVTTLPKDPACGHGAHAVLERDATTARRDLLLELLQQGDEVLVPTISALGDTADDVVSVIRRMLDRGASVRLLREGLDGATFVRAMDALALAALRFPDAAASAAMRRPWRRSTPADVTENINLSRMGRPVARIGEAVGLSVGTIARIRCARGARQLTKAVAVGARSTADALASRTVVRPATAPDRSRDRARRKEVIAMPVIDMDLSRPERPDPADQAIARRIAERIHRWGMPPPRSSGRLDGPARAAAADLMQAVQGLHDAVRAVEIRTYRAESLPEAFEAEQAGWAAEEEGVEAVTEALAELRQLGVAVAVTTGDARSRKAGITLGLAW
ncbi:hypothetical protein FBY14_107174 [Azospirillum brasilense]|nr:hypothetical protein FBY14_107174 [Azospirillum brasilense]